MKQTQSTSKPKRKIIPAALSPEQVEKRHGISTKAQSKAEKSAGKGVTRNWEREGARDGRKLWVVDQAADKARIEVLMEMGRTLAHLGLAESNGKKPKFHPEIESYFTGMRNWARNDLGEDTPAYRSFQNRYADARRVMFNYIRQGRTVMDAKLSGEGGYHEKIGSLLTLGGSEPKQPGTKKSKKEKTNGTTPETVSEFAKAEREQRITIAAKFTETELRDIIGALPESQLSVVAKILASRCRVSKDKALQNVAKAITKQLGAEDEEQAPVDKEAQQAAA